MAYYEDIIYDNNRVKCNLCSVYIKDQDISIEAHLDHESHTNLEVRRTLSQNSIVINDNNFYCHICGKAIDKFKLVDHLQSPHHLDIIQKIKKEIKLDGVFVKLPEELSEHGASIKCLICGSDCCVTFTLDSVTCHIKSDRHRRARAIAIQPFNGIFSVEGSCDYLWCKFCKVYLKNYIEILFEHVDDNAEHRERVKKILNLIRDQNITIEKYLMDPAEDKSRCLKCDREVACNVDNLERHVKGKLHNK